MANHIMAKKSIKRKMALRFVLLFLIFVAQGIVSVNSVTQVNNNNKIAQLQSVTIDRLANTQYQHQIEDTLVIQWVSGLEVGDIQSHLDDFNATDIILQTNYDQIDALLTTSQKVDENGLINFAGVFDLLDNLTTNFIPQVNDLISGSIFSLPSFSILSNLLADYESVKFEVQAVYSSIFKYFIFRNSTYLSEYDIHYGRILGAVQQIEFQNAEVEDINQGIFDTIKSQTIELRNQLISFRNLGNTIVFLLPDNANATELTNEELNEILTDLNSMEVIASSVTESTDEMISDNTDLLDQLKKNSGIAGTQIGLINDLLQLLVDWASDSQITLLTRSQQIVRNQQILLLIIAIIGFAFVMAITFDINRQIIDPIESVADWSNIIARGDLTRAPRGTVKAREREDEVGVLVNNFRSMNSNLREIISEVHETNSLIVLTAEELSSNSQEVNATAEEVSAIAQSMATGSAQQAEIINLIVEELQEADEVVNRVINQITNNLNIVKDLSEQTNVLALNTAIEAANAGDFGKGFTVIAENIRKMSDQSSRTAKTITLDSRSILNQLQTTFSNITEKIENVAAVSEETAASAQEVAASAMEMTSNMEQIAAKSSILNDQSVSSMLTVSKFTVSEVEGSTEIIMDGYPSK